MPRQTGLRQHAAAPRCDARATDGRWCRSSISRRGRSAGSAPRCQAASPWSGPIRSCRATAGLGDRPRRRRNPWRTRSRAATTAPVTVRDRSPGPILRGQLRRSHSPASRAPADHPVAMGVNRDASLFCRAPGSGRVARHGGVAPAAGLVAPSGALSERRRARCGAVAGAINLAAVAAATDQRPERGSPRTGTAGQTPPSAWIAEHAGGRTPRLPGYWPRMRARHGVGHGVEPNRQVQIGAVLAPQDRQV